MSKPLASALPRGLSVRHPDGEDHARVQAVLGQWWPDFAGEAGKRERAALLRASASNPATAPWTDSRSTATTTAPGCTALSSLVVSTTTVLHAETPSEIRLWSLDRGSPRVTGWGRREVKPSRCRALLAGCAFPRRAA